MRCHQTDLTPLANTLHHHAAALPHPALEQAARDHADFLTDLAAGSNLLARQIILIAREPAPQGASRRAGEGRVLQRVAESSRALAGAELTVTPLNAEASADLVGTACNPDTPLPTMPPLEGDPA